MSNNTKAMLWFLAGCVWTNLIYAAGWFFIHG